MVRRRLSAGDLIFGDYEVVALAGVGATSFVYRCLVRREGMPAEVAVKVLHDDLVGLEPSRRRFLREAHLLGELDHPGIVKVHEIIQTPLLMAYVMDHIEGPSLKEWFSRRPAGLDPAVQSMTLELLSALDYIHERGIIHRDIKPANILMEVSSTGVLSPKLIDFGVARLADAGPDPEDLHAIRGTAAYISPDEIRSPFEVCASSDLYSLGVLLYEAAAGVRPFDGRPNKELLCAHLHTTPAAPSVYNDTLHPAFDEVILTLLAKTPETRYETAGVLQRAFISAIAETLEPEIPIEVDAPQLSAEAQWLATFQLVLLHLILSLLGPGNTGQASDPHYLSRPYVDVPALV